MQAWIELQRIGHLSQLLIGIQGEIDKDPFPTSELARAASAPSEPLVANLIAQKFRDVTTLFE